MVLHLPQTLLSNARHYLIKKSDPAVGSVPEELFETVLRQYSDVDTVFVHIGLSDVSSAFDGDPYDFIMDRLEAEFSSILAPGFTKSFRESHKFDVRESEPELGAFSSLFFGRDMEYRTPDPLHSIMVKGDYRFEGCDFRDTFSEDGCYGRLENDDVLCLNVGTQWLVSTQLHYLEQYFDVPYVDTVDIDGEIVLEDGTEKQITQTNYDKNNYIYFWNRRKICEDMLEEGRLDHYELNGLSVTGFRLQNLAELVGSKVQDDPYYLVR